MNEKKENVQRKRMDSWGVGGCVEWTGRMEVKREMLHSSGLALLVGRGGSLGGGVRTQERVDLGDDGVDELAPLLLGERDALLAGLHLARVVRVVLADVDERLPAEVAHRHAAQAAQVEHHLLALLERARALGLRLSGLVAHPQCVSFKSQKREGEGEIRKKASANGTQEKKKKDTVTRFHDKKNKSLAQRMCVVKTLFSHSCENVSQRHENTASDTSQTISPLL